MGQFLAQRMVKLLIQANISVKCVRIGIFGLTFKENVPDMRNSRVPDIVNELRQFGIEPAVHDPVADPAEAMSEYGIRLEPLSEMHSLDGAILAVGHQAFTGNVDNLVARCLSPGGVLMDVKSVLDPAQLPGDVNYWCL